ncbi:hypothetical protein IWW37_006073, partial [Coemansia sp. RSA 2050]
MVPGPQSKILPQPPLLQIRNPVPMHSMDPLMQRPGREVEEVGTTALLVGTAEEVGVGEGEDAISELAASELVASEL